jgi:hypothetical protein
VKIAYETLIAAADERYRRRYMALQAWTLTIIPMVLGAQFAGLRPIWISVAWGVWLSGIWLLQKRWRESFDHATKLREERLDQLVADVLKECRQLEDCHD